MGAMQMSILSSERVHQHVVERTAALRDVVGDAPPARAATERPTGQSIREARLAQMKQLPPGLTVVEIARRLGISQGWAHTCMHEAGYPFRRVFRRNQKVPQEQWEKINWQLSNAEIARKLRVSRERVRQIRLREGLPKVGGHEKHQESVRPEMLTGS